jgi:hypothetical protein
MPNGTILGLDSTGQTSYYAANLSNIDAWKSFPSAVAISKIRSLRNGSVVGLQRTDGSLVHRWAERQQRQQRAQRPIGGKRSRLLRQPYIWKEHAIGLCVRRTAGLGPSFEQLNSLHPAGMQAGAVDRLVCANPRLLLRQKHSAAGERVADCHCNQWLADDQERDLHSLGPAERAGRPRLPGQVHHCAWRWWVASLLAAAVQDYIQVAISAPAPSLIQGMCSGIPAYGSGMTTVDRPCAVAYLASID